MQYLSLYHVAAHGLLQLKYLSVDLKMLSFQSFSSPVFMITGVTITECFLAVSDLLCAGLVARPGLGAREGVWSVLRPALQLLSLPSVAARALEQEIFQTFLSVTDSVHAWKPPIIMP